MPPKRNAARQRPSVSSKKAPAQVKVQPTGSQNTHEPVVVVAEKAANAEALSLLRLRSSLTPISGAFTVSPAGPSPSAELPGHGATTAVVKPGLLLRSRARTATAPAVTRSPANSLLARNEEDNRLGPRPAFTVRPSPHSAVNEEAEVETAGGSVEPSGAWRQSPATVTPLPDSFAAFATPSRAFTVSSPVVRTPQEESLARLRAVSVASLNASVASAPVTKASPGPLRTTGRTTTRGQLSALTEKSANALRELRAATSRSTTTVSPPPPPLRPAVESTATTEEPAQGVTRALKDGRSEMPSDVARVWAPFVVPAPRSSTPFAARPSLKRGRDKEAEDAEEAEKDAMALEWSRRRIEPPQEVAKRPSDRMTSPSRRFALPVPRSQQRQPQGRLAHAEPNLSSPSLAALRAASVPQRSSPLRRSGGGERDDLKPIATNALFQMADVIESRFSRESSTHELGETSPLSRASLHSENLSTPLRVQLHDTRNFVERYQSEPSAPAAQPFRVISAPSADQASPFSQRLSDWLATAQGHSVAPTRSSTASAASGPLLRGLTETSLPTSQGTKRGSTRTLGRRRSSAASPTQEVAANAVSFSGKPRCVVFDTSSLLESQPGPLNLLMEKWIACIPFTVLDELDKIHKSDLGKASAGTRADREWRKRRAHELRNWIASALKQNNAHIRLQKRMEVVEEYDRKAASNDDSILGFAVFLKRRNENVLFVSEDKFLRIKATSELGNAYAYAELLKMLGVRK